MQLSDIQKKLEAEKTALAIRIEEVSAQDPFTDPERANDNAASDTDAGEESTHDRFAAQVEELKAQAVALDEALARIVAGTYGVCVSCGNNIEEGRLSALPTAALCLSCESKKKK